MSVQTELTRILSARNSIRNKGVTLGIMLGTDNITEVAAKFETIINHGAVHEEVKEGETFQIPKGFHDGSGTISGVAGGGAYDLQDKTATPTKATQNIVPDAGYFGLSNVTINPIPDIYQDVTEVTAVATDVLAGKLFVVTNGTLTPGTMPNNGAIAETMDVLTTTSISIPEGYHNGSGTVRLADDLELALAAI